MIRSLPCDGGGTAGKNTEVRMKTRLTLLLIALVLGGPVLAEIVHSISVGVLIFGWMLGIWGPGVTRRA